ncbi:MAG: hypothetical protein HQ526_06460 [Actinobacteria bacterium]|nr:hypothetical protein [Actinomycetota bacterium]
MIRPGCILIGIYLVVTAVADCSSLPARLSRYEAESNEMVLIGNWPDYAMAIAGAVLVFQVIPGALLMIYARNIARRFHESDPFDEVSDSGLYVVLMLALAAFFLISGTASAVVGLTQLVSEIVEHSEYRSFQIAFMSLTNGTVKILGAVALYYHSLAAARNSSQAPDA